MRRVFRADLREPLVGDEQSAASDQTNRLAPGRRRLARRVRGGAGSRETRSQNSPSAERREAIGSGTQVADLPSGSRMIERRRAERFDLADPGVGSLRLVHDVQIAQVGAREAVVVAPGPLPRGERLLLEIPLHRGAAPSTVLVRVVHNRVIVDDGSLRRRVRLELLDQSTQTARIAAEFRRLQRAQREPMMGALIRRVPVRVVQASTGGCVMECPSIIVEGSVGFVQITSSTQGHSEAVRISRTSQLANRVWQYRMAAEFLTLGPASPQSLRGVATLMTG